MDFNERADRRYTTLAALFTGLDELTADLLWSYCVVSEQVDDLNARIEKEGYFVRTEKGLKENPVVNTVHKLNADKARFFAPLKRSLSKQAVSTEDDLDAFLA